MKKAIVVLISIISLLMLVLLAYYFELLPFDGAIPVLGETVEERNPERDRVLMQAENLARGYFYEEALQLLNENEELINDEIRELEARIVEEKNSLVRFEGQIKHIFFHSLILYPEYLFTDLTVPTGGYNEGFVFQSEFKRLLPQLLERGYVLYNINDIFGTDENGNMIQNDIYLPPGRRPLILSIDDPTYHYEAGFANRMVLDENGELATEVITPDGEMIITHDGDIQLILNAFVEEHPEFSYRGHKGIIATTGFMGIFGHDLQTEESISEAKAVVERLKETGWIFANHSFTHNRVGFWGPDTRVENIEWDIRRWREKMEPVVGSTNVFIAPFGYRLSGEAMNVIIRNGYNIYCTVDFRQNIEIFPNQVVMGRIEIGGFSLVRWRDRLNTYFFDVDTVIDPHRPPILH